MFIAELGEIILFTQKVNKRWCLMNNAVDIDFVLDKKYPDPNVTIRAKEKTRLFDNIIQAVENVSR